MSSAEIAAKVIKGLSREEVKALNIFSQLIYDYKVVDEYILSEKGKMHIDRVRFALSKLNEKKLVFKEEKGYVLLTAGLDAIALKILADKDIIQGLGRAIGIGKESDVFEGISNNERVAVKFFRIGRISFRDLRKRGFKEAHNWLIVNIEAAKNEFNVLNRLYMHCKVPKPIANVKHVIVMQFIEGYRLSYIKLDKPEFVLRLILDEIKKAYRLGVISADLSEYNILYDGKGIWLIDFPQAISIEHKDARLLLERDLRNIIRYFNRKYKIEYSLDKALEYITS
ncbi:MAG: serine/threonine protein kinase [Candidatus Nitrosocaldaceae archaeon]|nr:MAG: serine/threonine protein kinase [Candidatus Nitrosocaldaceae archaeon]